MLKEGFTTLTFKFSPLGTITAPYGDISQIHPHGHRGVDIACPTGQTIYSPLDGIVSRIVDQPESLGNGVFIKTQYGFQMVFGHLSEVRVRINEIVHRGEDIGLCGSTGNSTASHLHFGIIDNSGKFIDPAEIFRGIKSVIAMYTNKATEAFIYLESLDNNIIEMIQTVSIPI